MFDNIRLFAKPYNKVQEPSVFWTAQATIHCSFELNLGFAHKAIWNAGNSIKLRKLIRFLADLNDLIVDRRKNELVFNLKNNEVLYSLIWVLENNEIRAKAFRKIYDSTTFISEKRFSLMEIDNFTKRFFISVISLLSEKTNDAVTSSVGELFFRGYHNIDFEFKIGQKVETVVGKNVKTQRKGVIANKLYHYKQKTTMYQLLSDGKILRKRYLPTDLKLIEQKSDS